MRNGDNINEGGESEDSFYDDDDDDSDNNADDDRRPAPGQKGQSSKNV